MKWMIVILKKHMYAIWFRCHSSFFDWPRVIWCRKNFGALNIKFGVFFSDETFVQTFFFSGGAMFISRENIHGSLIEKARILARWVIHVSQPWSHGPINERHLEDGDLETNPSWHLNHRFFNEDMCGFSPPDECNRGKRKIFFVGIPEPNRSFPGGITPLFGGL